MDEACGGVEERGFWEPEVGGVEMGGGNGKENWGGVD